MKRKVSENMVNEIGFSLFQNFSFFFWSGCTGSSWLPGDFLQLWQAPHRGGFSCCRARGLRHWGFSSIFAAPGSRVRVQQLWLMGSAVPQHMGSSPTRGGTRVSCIGKQILIYCATNVCQESLDLHSSLVCLLQNNLR